MWYFYAMLQQHIILAIAWIFFCLLHSVLAGNGIKRRLAQTSANFFKYYRLFYTVFAFVTFIAVIIYQLRISSPLLFIPLSWLNIAGAAIAITGAAIMVVCIKKYFLSLSGLKSLFANSTVANELRIDGIHKFVRHPLYLGTFIFIWGLFFIYPYLSLFIAFSIITLYTIISLRFEEEKLVEEFCTVYKDYKAKVPALIPFMRSV